MKATHEGSDKRVSMLGESAEKKLCEKKSQNRKSTSSNTKRGKKKEILSRVMGCLGIEEARKGGGKPVSEKKNGRRRVRPLV